MGARDQHQLEAKRYLVLTLHRPANVDDPVQFFRMLKAIGEAAHGFPVLFPVHPRTAKTMRTLSGVPSNILPLEPQPYLEFNFLVKNAMAVITDSGGITEETTVMGVPCLTLRDTTERPETVTVGTNELVGTDPNGIAPVLARVLAGRWKSGAVPEKWDGQAASRSVAHLETLLIARDR